MVRFPFGFLFLASLISRIPFARGQELAAQHGVTAYLSPIFDFVPSPANVAALPVTKGELAGGATPDRAQKTPSGLGAMGYTPMMSAPTPTHAGRIYSPMPPQHELQPPPHFMTSESMMLPPHPMYGGMYYPQLASHDELGPAVELNGYGLPPSHADVYYDAYGQPHSTHVHINGAAPSDAAMEPPAKRLKSDEHAMAAQVEEESIEEQGSEWDSETDEPAQRGQPVPTAMRLSKTGTGARTCAGSQSGLAGCDTRWGSRSVPGRAHADTGQEGQRGGVWRSHAAARDWRQGVCECIFWRELILSSSLCRPELTCRSLCLKQ